MITYADFEETLAERWPDHLDLHTVKHSEQAYSCTLLDVDFRVYVFRCTLSEDLRWSIVPIAGFETPIEGSLVWGDLP